MQLKGEGQLVDGKVAEGVLLQRSPILAWFQLFRQFPCFPGPLLAAVGIHWRGNLGCIEDCPRPLFERERTRDSVSLVEQSQTQLDGMVIGVGKLRPGGNSSLCAIGKGSSQQGHKDCDRKRWPHGKTPRQFWLRTSISPQLRMTSMARQKPRSRRPALL